MKKYIFGSIFILAFSWTSLSAQIIKSKFYGTAYGTIGKREKVNALSFTTQNNTDSFFNALSKTFGSPSIDKYFFTYDFYKKSWSKDRIILRIEKSIDIESDTSKIYDIFIFVETKKQVDLLINNTDSYKKIKHFFLSLYNKTVKTANLDPGLRFE